MQQEITLRWILWDAEYQWGCIIPIVSSDSPRARPDKDESPDLSESQEGEVLLIAWSLITNGKAKKALDRIRYYLGGWECRQYSILQIGYSAIGQ